MEKEKEKNWKTNLFLSGYRPTKCELENKNLKKATSKYFIFVQRQLVGQFSGVLVWQIVWGK